MIRNAENMTYWRRLKDHHLAFCRFVLDGSSSSSLVWTGNLELLSFDSVPKVFLYSCVDAKEEEGLFSIFSE